MTTKTTKIYLSYLSKSEKQNMTKAMPFLTQGGTKNMAELLDVARELYGEGVRLDPLWDNGHYPSEWHAKTHDKESHFYTLMEFKKEHLTDSALTLLGQTDSQNFPYYYGIALNVENRMLYAVSFYDDGRPNWNNNYWIVAYKMLDTIEFPLLREGGVIDRMEDSLHGDINRRLASRRPLFVESEGRVQMTVNDQHGNYTVIEGATVEQVFRDYADNYTGYRNYRRQMASEWEISDPAVKARYEEWKQTATGLKSDFDKFYGGGIVD